MLAHILECEEETDGRSTSPPPGDDEAAYQEEV